MKTNRAILAAAITSLLSLQSGWAGMSSIEWSGPQNLQVFAGLTTEVDIDGNGVLDFLLYHDPGGVYLLLDPLSANAATALPSGTGGTQREWLPIPPNTSITQSLPGQGLWEQDVDLLVAYFSVPPGDSGDGGTGPWHDVTYGILGTQFDIDGQTHYGWIRMSDVDALTFIVHDWAYETQPGVGIAAGMIPEPSTIGLIVFGLATLLWRRMRNSSRV